jgi:nucleoside triphosphate pyrophosphatase
MATRPLVLASASPQRRAILRRLGVPFTARAVDVVELEEGDPAEVARENALRKARAARALGSAGGAVVLGCDTLVVLDGIIYGKPADARAARATLRALGGATHEVLSGLALLTPGDGGSELCERTASARTRVTFRTLTEGLLDWYLATGEWRGRAGGYAIQGAGAALVRSVEGDYENVVGLPVATLLDICPELLQG